MKADILLLLAIILALAGFVAGFNACMGMMMEGTHHPEPWYFAAMSLCAFGLAAILYLVYRKVGGKKGQNH